MIFYLLGDYAPQSWGNGMIYAHVGILREAGYDACALHQHAPFRPDWLDVDVPIRYLDEAGFAATEQDTVVVPDVLSTSPSVQQFPWHRIVFVQGSFSIVYGLGDHADYAELGFETAITILPHIARVIERHFGVSANVVPPFIAPYFFSGGEIERARRVLFPLKPGYGAFGIPDQEIARRLLQKEIAKRPQWTFTLLEKLRHREVAALMQSSMFLVNVYSHEGFNTTVPEAMAAGCVPVCYEAGGGVDFLRPGENAIVFPNQHVYPLIDRVCQLIDDFDGARTQDLLQHIRRGGHETAKTFNRERTADALLRFFSARGA
ncbi:MAG TPA: glycosyltransferase [Thermoanaerobaculia bacterium]|nr:glycosyltransferase [Thermoanaerobaculia bacterium]